MYSTLLFLHSWLRWALLLVGIIVIIRAFSGWLGNKDYLKSHDAFSISLIALFHLQLILGLLLFFFFSPIVNTAFQNFGAAMKDSQLRFWTVEHGSIMVLSILIAQFGRIKIKKAVLAVDKFRNEAIYFTLAYILILSRIPWDQNARMFRGILE